MYIVQVHSVTLFGEAGKLNKPRNVFLDISNEGQPPRRYFIGRFLEDSTINLESVVHLTRTPVTLHMCYGPLMYHDLGHLTLFDFLNKPMTENPPEKKFLTFGRRGPVYHLCYSIRRITQSYSFSLNSVTCLRQIAGSYRHDTLFAEVEFNQSPQSVGGGPTNRYHLGNFKSHDQSAIHSIHNLSFSSLANFVITVYVRSMLADHILGTVKFTPAYEVVSNSPIYPPHIFPQNSVPLPIPPLATSLSAWRNQVDKDYTNTNTNNKSSSSSNTKNTVNNNSNSKNTNNNSNSNTTTPNSNSSKNNNATNNKSAESPSLQNADNTTSILSKPNEDIQTKESSEGLLLWISNSPFMEQVLLLNDKDIVHRKLILSSPHVGGSYEISFSLTKSPYMGEIIDIIEEEKDSVAALKAGSHKGCKCTDCKCSLGVYLCKEDCQCGKKLLTSQVKHESSELLNSGNSSAHVSANNSVSVLIDGLQTFRSYFEALMDAKHTIDILAWELSLDFGLILTQDCNVLPILVDPQTQKWVSIEDVILSQALSGVKVRIIVWRHELLSNVTRFLYLGAVTIESEVARLERRCKKLGLVVKVLHTKEGSNTKKVLSQDDPSANVVVIIAGNPEGILSSHHEKLLLVDSACPAHSVAFIGGFDMAIGRYDQPLHQIPRPYLPDISIPPLNISLSNLSLTTPKNYLSPSPNTSVNSPPPPRYNGRSVQPILRPIRFLWHDVQLRVKGPSTQQFRLHFEQRWSHSFTQNISHTRHIQIPFPENTLYQCTKNHQPSNALKEHEDNPPTHSGCDVRLFRVWTGVLSGHFLFDNFRSLVLGAKKFLYVEHQYPFQNFTLAYYMCEALRSNPNLKVLIVTPVKTDLPSGLVGELFDWSQDHIIKHLHLIHSVAPDRVGVYGLVKQDENSKRIKPIYVHSKLIISDDAILNVGSTNMDNMSFFYSSELNASIVNKEVASQTRQRLVREHLQDFYTPEMDDNFDLLFETFRKVAKMNQNRSRNNEALIGRPVIMAPIEDYEFLLKHVYYPSKISKLLYKMGVNTEELWAKFWHYPKKIIPKL
eukprot:TRINITY_DN3420_c0_g1_i1.p1 TRINITY_DN3420_c0_g1~~TRINITY_DN3420_c0_g1_i1.p1  ORF type:complete len:1058 (-),score=232.48 TRINITY_DN3420_c0_g1_i1:937-4110(-)